MQARPRRRLAWFCLPLALAIVISAITSVWEVSVPAAYAQERVRPWSLRDLFLPRRVRREAPPEVRSRPSKPRSKATRKSVAKQKPEPAIIVVPKEPGAKTVLVVGDFVGKGLAEGLNAVFADNPKVRIVDRTSNASGFVREDHFDWPGQIGQLVTAEKPAAIIVMMGANDRQTMRIGEARETLRSEPWLREYSARAASFASAAVNSGTPMLWVGATPFRSPKMSADMLALNEIYRKVSADVGAEFIDVWEGFVDENGTFVIAGPDVNGQPVKLRSSDGINFTTAGKRKLAFYTEKPLKRLLGEALGVPTPSGIPTVSVPGIVIPTNRTAPIALNDPALDGGSELLGATATQSTFMGPAGVKPAPRDPTPKPALGRADDFSWPRKDEAGTATPASADTTATASTTGNAAKPAN